MKKKLISMLLVISMVLALLPGYDISALAATLPATLSVEPTEANNLPAAIDLVLRDKDNNNGDYCLYLPGDASVEDCFFSWEGGLKGSVSSVSYSSGAMPIPPVGQTKTYSFSTGSSTKTFKVTTYQGSGAVPPVFIEIDESQGTIAAMNADPDHETSCTGIIFIDGEEYELDKIKGRGNATWNFAKEKRPYNITLGKKVSSILGIEMPEKTKKFSMLANIADHSLLRNKIGYDMSYALDIGLDSASADVWMNGEYMGVYLIMAKNDSFISDDGYGIEDDNYTEPSIEEGGDPSFVVSGTVVPGGRQTRITVKKIGDNLLPDGESVASLKAATVPIQEYVQDVWDAIRSEDGYNSKGKYYAEYVDMQSWAAMYLMQEFVRGYDANAGSLLFHRDGTTDADKLFAGPMWDLDNALGSNQGGGAHGVTLRDANGWFLRNIADSKGSIYQAIGKHEDFMDEVYRVYNQNQKVFDEAAAQVQELARDLKASAEMNHVRITKETYNNARYSSRTVLAQGTDYEQVYKATNSWQDYVDNLETFASVRAHFFRDNLTREDLVFRGRFSTGIGSSVTAFDTRDTSGEGTPNAEVAFSRNGETGELDSSGNGEINFRVDVNAGYKASGVTAVPAANYDEIISLGDGFYRITGITGTVVITVATEDNGCAHIFQQNTCTLCGAKAFAATIQKTGNAAIKVFDDRSYSGAGQLNPASVLARNGETGKVDLTGSGEVNFTATVPEGYRVGRIKVEPEGNYDQLLRPAATGVTNGYRITGIRGDITVTMDTAVLSNGIDFTDPASEGSFEIINQHDSVIREGEGLYMVVTQDAFEPCVDKISTFNPRDVVMVPVSGDWTATLEYTFNKNGSGGSYAYFGFYAMKDYNNCAGIRGGDSNLQDFLRVNGKITQETKNSSPGLSTSGNFWYRIEKVGTTYTCYRSDDGENFKKMFVHENTGIEAENLCIDAYTGSATGWDFLVKTLEIEGEGGIQAPASCQHSYETAVTPPTCTAEGFTTYTCSLCGDSYTEDKVDALGHSYEEGKCTGCGKLKPGAEAVYGFADMSREELLTDWEIIREASNEWTLGEDGLTIQTASGDLYQNNNDAHNIFLRDGDGDWTLEAKINFPTALSQNYQQAALLAYQDDDNYIKLSYEYGGRAYLQFGSEQNARFSSNGSLDFSGGELYCRLVKSGDTYTAFYSTDGVSYTQIGEPITVALADPKVGFAAINGYDSGADSMDVNFEYVRLERACDHAYESAVTPPTCVEEGYTTHTCTVCGDSYVDSEVDALGHSYKDTVTKPTCVEEGYTTRTCTVCGDSYTGERVAAKGHSWDPGSITTYPTEDAEGVRTYVCTVCGTRKQESIPTLAHKHSYSAVTTQPTCTDAGFTTYTCAKCGDSYRDKAVSALGHNYKNVVTKPTCTEGGYTTHTCTRCEDSYVDTLVSALGHDYKNAVTKPTCVESGYTTHTCTVCGSSYTDTQVAATGHSWDDGTVTTQPTENAAGVKTYSCTACDESKEVSIPPIGHKHVYKATVTEPTCVDGGYTIYLCETCGDSYEAAPVSALGHDFEAVVTPPTCAASGYTTHTCTRCDESYIDSVTAKPGHSYKAVVTEPTCTSAGYATHVCENCGDTYVDSVVEALQHDYKASVKQPTCAAPGSTTYVCERCDHTYTDSEGSTPAHDYIEVVTEATCASAGFTTHVCKACGASYIDSWTGALDHDYTDVVTPPTCVSAGFTTHVCKTCAHSYVDSVVSAAGHDYRDAVQAPTCVEPGITVHTCKVCGDSYVSDEVAATGHKWDEGKVTVQPTAEKAGEKVFICAVCDETVTVSLAPVEHIHSYKEEITKPTCTTAGYTTFTCACGESYRDAMVSALGHDYDSVVTAPGCLTTGYTTHTCTVCGESYRDTQTSATGHDWDEGKVTTQPTEEKEGVTTFTCAACEEIRTEPIPKLIPDHKHDYKAVVTEPTCVDGGYTTYTCACGDTYTDDKTEALGHSYEAVVSEPECLAAGYTTYTCTGCAHSYVTDETEATGHAFADGICTVCGAKDDTLHICPAKKFPDVDVSLWYHDAIDFVLSKGMMNGTGNGAFAPNAALSRAMLVQILYNIEGKPAYETELTFTDVAEGAWYYDAVMWAAENGIVLGIGDGTVFAPDANVTREQMVTILYRYAKSPEVKEAELTFADAADVSDWAAQAVAWAAENGVVKGVGDNKFAPKDNTTRAATAQVCMNYFGK